LELRYKFSVIKKYREVFTAGKLFVRRSLLPMLNRRMP
jgi:hypothetical protein